MIIKTFAEYKEIHDKVACEDRCQCSHLCNEHSSNFIDDLNINIKNVLDKKCFEYCQGADSFELTRTSTMTAEQVYKLVKCPCREFKPLKKKIEVRYDTYNELMKAIATTGGETIDDIIMERVDAYRKIREGV